MGGTEERNEQTRRWMQKGNGELTVIFPTGGNEDEENQWDRKRWVILIEIFMYFENAYILSWDETTAFYDKWEHQLDATIKYIFHLKLVSTCFGRDIAHHQGITKLYISAYGNRPCNEEKLT